MKRLILLPDSPGTHSGYQKAVSADLNRLHVCESDFVIVYASDEPSTYRPHATLSRSRGLWQRRIRNLCKGAPLAEVHAAELQQLTKGRSFDTVFCGDTIFYRAARRAFPNAGLIVRFHNLFSVALYRRHLLRVPVSAYFRYMLRAYARLEGEILSDAGVSKIFITPEERACAKLAFPSVDGEVWDLPGTDLRDGYDPGIPRSRKLVFMGSLPIHTRTGVEWLISRVFPRIRSMGFELHLYGRGTRRYDRPSAGVFGHGPYEGNDLPMAGEAIYCVPDLLGGGIKVKTGDLVRSNVPVLATPFACEGYRLPQHPMLLIRDLDEWPEALRDFAAAVKS